MASAFHLSSLKLKNFAYNETCPLNKGQKVLTTKHGVANVL